MPTLKKLIIMVAVFGVIMMALNSIPAIGGLKMALHGWGLPILIVAGFAGSYVGNFIARCCAERIGMSLIYHPLTIIVLRVFWYCCFAGAWLMGAKYLPQYFEASNALGLYVFFGSIGLGMGICDWIDGRFSFDESN